MLKAARAAKGLTQSEAASRLKVTQGTISDWERDVYNMRLCDFTRLCKVYGIDNKMVLETLNS